MSAPRVAIIASASSEFSASLATDFADALRLDFPSTSIITLDRQFTSRLRDFSLHVVIFSRPLGIYADTASGIAALHHCQIPHVGTPPSALATTQSLPALTAILRSAGIPIAKDFYVEQGDDIAELLKKEPASDSAERELSVAVLDDPFPQALPVVEIDETKILGDHPPRMYMAGDYEDIYACPARLDEAIAQRAKEIAVAIHLICGCQGLSRMFMALREGVLTVRSLHIHPIVSEGSLFFKAARESGYTYADLLWQLASHAGASSYGVIDIKSDENGLAGALSNFHPYPFVVDNIPCASMEGLLQTLKCIDHNDQRKICALVGVAAKQEGAKHNSDWQSTQTLYWQGLAMDRHGEAYQQFIDRAYRALFDQNIAFQGALRESGQRFLRHKLGSKDPAKTVLTEREFIRRLYALRNH